MLWRFPRIGCGTLFALLGVHQFFFIMKPKQRSILSSLGAGSGRRTKGIASLLLLLSVVVLAAGYASYSLPVRVNNTFQKGEYLRYRVYYNSMLTGNITAGELLFSVLDTTRVINGRNTHHVRVIGRTRGVFNLFYKVNDRYETFIDEELLIPRFFIRRVDEGGHIKRQNVTFFHEHRRANFVDLQSNRRVAMEVPSDIQDVLSMIYYARTLDLNSAKTGDRFDFNFLIDDTVYTSSLEVLGREVIRTSLGQIRCVKLRPGLITGDMFSDEYAMELYISDDRNRLPVLMSTGVIVGSVKMELTDYENLVHPFSSLTPRRR